MTMQGTKRPRYGTICTGRVKGWMRERRAAGRELRCFFLIGAIVAIVTIGGNLRGASVRRVKG